MKYQTSQPRDLDHQPPRTAQICALRHLKRKNDVEAKEANIVTERGKRERRCKQYEGACGGGGAEGRV